MQNSVNILFLNKREYLDEDSVGLYAQLQVPHSDLGAFMANRIREHDQIFILFYSIYLV